MSDDHRDRNDIRSIRSIVQSFRRAQIYTTFAELEIGPALQHEAQGVEQLASSIGADAAALRRFLDAAIAFHLVHERDDGRIELTQLGRNLYAPSSEHSAPNAIKLEAAFYRRWGRLTEAIRSGRRPEANRAQEDDPGWVRMFTMALYENSRETAEAVAHAVAPILEGRSGRPLRILDLGGGHGGYSIALARTNPDVQVSVFDLPPVMETTREIIASSEAAEQVSAVAGGFHVDPIGRDFDAIMLFGVLHGETPENADRLLDTVHSALRPDGVLLIRSQGKPQSEPEPGERELFDLHMLLSSEGGRVQRSPDTLSLVKQHGFVLQRELVIESPGSGQILVFEPGVT